MPSACTKPEYKASLEAQNQVAQCISIVEKKVRNLEKRKGKLDVYRDKQDNGETLNEDQQEAVTKYEAVIQTLEFARELQKQFQSISTEIEKMSKKQVKRQKAERQEHEISRIRELLKLQDLLTNMGSEEVRDHFKNGTNGAITLSEEDLSRLDELYKLITPSRDGDVSYMNQLTQASEHIVNFLDGREKEVAGTSYKQFRELVDKIEESGYFEKIGSTSATDTAGPEETEQPQHTDETEPEEPTSQPEQTLETVESSHGVVSELPVSHAVDPAPATQTSLEPEPQSLSAMPTSALGLTHEHPDGSEYVDEESYYSAGPQTASPEAQQLQQKPRRELQEIVSSVQGSFNFLQDSEIESEYTAGLQHAGFLEDQSASQSPAGYSQQSGHHSAAQQPTHHSAGVKHHPGHHAAAPSQTQQHKETLDFGAVAAASSIVDGLQQSSAGSQLQFGAVDSMVPSSEPGASVTLASGNQQPTTSLDAAYDQSYSQNMMGGSAASQHVSYGDQSTSNLMSSHMSSLADATLDGLGSATSSAVPQPIPLPNQSLPGQPLMSSQNYSESDSAAAAQQQEKKQYTMNPNADPFHSSTTIFSQMSQQQSSAGGAASVTTDTSLMSSVPHQEEPPVRKSAWQTPPQAAPSAVSEEQQEAGAGDFQGSGYSSGGFGRNSGAAPPRGRGAPRGSRGMNNGYSNTRGTGNRGGSSYGGGNRGSSSAAYTNGRGSSRGGSAWQNYPTRNDYRQQDGSGYQGFNSGSYSNQGMRGGPARGGGGMRSNRGSSAGGGFGRATNQAYAQQG